jgi:hypothetical protein
MIIDQVVSPVGDILSQINGEIMLTLVVMGVSLLLTLLLSLRQTRNLSKQLKRVQHELKVSGSSMISIGQQLLSLEKKVNQQALLEPVERSTNATIVTNNIDSERSKGVKESDFKLSNVSTDNTLLDEADLIYEEARYYLSKGDDIETIAKRCNLSHAEVSLLKALSKKPAGSL